VAAKLKLKDVKVEDIKAGDRITWGTRITARKVMFIGEEGILFSEDAWFVNDGRQHSDITYSIPRDGAGREGFAVVIEQEDAATDLTPKDVQIGGAHYKDLPIQPIEYCIRNNIPFAEGNVIKYVTRWRKKNGIEDLKKARHMLDILIQEAYLEVPFAG
jgi:hypothetical protein